ncbi:Uma2 family endonuclease [Phormidium yuhuli AB48]|uniref:Uma2 family endonuclease n=1 Tax=Phormidium yuhuli AB48 TaxID=2940671 RepID=A0ABY5AQA9_9CYAN|nr:Uma2 family endonuclease [Phormidium yuhuli]USR91414.1 Uma2 family endonuclease [Phormidium yuhuli AB48]
MIAVPHYISPSDYLELEENSPHPHEYREGLVYAIAGGTDNHDRIALNLLSQINLHLGSSECRFYSGNVKVNYQDKFYYYPDAFVTCDERDRQDRHIKRHPKLIIEVLSKSTRDFDKGVKFNDYQQIEELEEYVLIEQEEQRVECRRRQSDNTWETVIYTLGDRVQLQSIDLELAIAQLYQGLD